MDSPAENRLWGWIDSYFPVLKPHLPLTASWTDEKSGCLNNNTLQQEEGWDERFMAGSLTGLFDFKAEHVPTTFPAFPEESTKSLHYG